MRVLHVITSLDPAYGGPATAVIGLSEAQHALGMQVKVVTTSTRIDSNSSIIDRINAAGIEVTNISPCHGPLRSHPDMPAILQKHIESVDVIHIHGVWEDVQHLTAKIAQKSKVPYIIRPCGMLSPTDLEKGYWKKKAYLKLRLKGNLDKAAAIHFTSEEECESARPLKISAPSIIEPNGVEMEEFFNYKPDGHFRKMLGMREEQLLVLFISRIHPRKGLDLLIPAFAEIKKKLGENAILAIAGMGDAAYREQVEGWVRKHELGDVVHFVGMLQGQDRVAALAEADLFVLPSYYENFGNAIVEALASATPVIISDRVGIREVVSSNGVGEVIENGVDTLSSALLKWLTDEALRARASQRAREAVLQFDWNQIARRWGAHYAGMTSKD